MIALNAMFWILVVLFGLVGMMRGWTKEIVATAGLVLSLFAQLWFGHYLIALLGPQDATPEATMRSQFVIRSLVHITFAFFAYQGPTLARQFSGGRFGDKARGNIQESLLGFVVGMINGYLIVGAVWAFLEYNIVDREAIRYAMEIPYPFPVDIISRPLAGTAYDLISKLPLPLLQGWLPLLVVVLFLFVIIAMI